MHRNNLVREMLIPGPAVPQVIGNAGATIKKLQETCGVKMMFLGANDDVYSERTLRIIARDEEHALQILENARQKVEDIVNESAFKESLGGMSPTKQQPQQSQFSTSWGAGNNVSDNEEATGEFLIPSSVFEKVVGPKAANLKSIKTSLQLPHVAVGLPRVVRAQEVRPVILRGPADKVDDAKVMLGRMVKSFAHTPTHQETRSTSFEPNGSRRRRSSSSEDDIPHSPTNGRENGTNSKSDSAHLIGRFNSQLNPIFKHQVEEINELANELVNDLAKEHQKDLGRMEVEYRRKLERVETEHKTETIKLRAVFENEGRGSVSNSMVKENIDLKRELRMLGKQVDDFFHTESQLKAELEDANDERSNLENEVIALKEEIHHLKAKPSVFLCKECGLNPRDTMYMPCLHFTYCKDCASKFKLCSICGKGVSSRLTVTLEKSAK